MSDIALTVPAFAVSVHGVLVYAGRVLPGLDQSWLTHRASTDQYKVLRHLTSAGHDQVWIGSMRSSSRSSFSSWETR